MAMPLTSHASLFSKYPKTLRLSSIPTQNPPFSFSKFSTQNHPFSSVVFYAASSRKPGSFSIKPPSASAGDALDSEASDQDMQHESGPVGFTDEWGEKTETEPEPEDSYTMLTGADPPRDEDEWGEKTETEPEPEDSYTMLTGADPPRDEDEWGEKTEPEPEDSYTMLPGADPPRDEDEWGRDGDGRDAYVKAGNGTAKAAAAEADEVGDLKRCLVDTVYGTNFGFQAAAEVRAEVAELVNQLEATNPTPAPTEAGGLLDGNWILLYTAASELLPLLAAGSTPLLQVKRICQSIETSSRTIVNSTTLSSPIANISFSASATFEVRSPSRIQVQFKEGTLQPPEIKWDVGLPDNVDVLGLKINLSPLQMSLNALKEAAATVSRTISGQPPLKVPIPGERNSSWLLITYLDKDIRISRGDGGLFVLAREGSPLLNLY